MEFDEILVVKQDHNFSYEEDCVISSSLTEEDMSHHPFVVMEDHREYYKDDPGGSSPALGQVPDIQQPTTRVAEEDVPVVKKDHNFYHEDPELSSSPPTVLQMVVLFLLAYMMDRHMEVNMMDFNIPSDPG